MKNLIFLIIDSLNYSHVKESELPLMPFYSKLKEKSISCENMYSQAPYTEAAVMNLYCGQDVLDDGGYLLRFKNAKKTIFEIMQENGYATYYNSYQPQCHPSSVKRGVDYLFYNVGYDSSALWSYRLSHYSELYKNDKLTDDDYAILKEILNDNFKEWILFTENIISNDDSVSLINGNSKDYDAESIKKEVSAEYEKYKNSPEKYINEILTEKTQHNFFKIPDYFQNNKLKDRSVIARNTQKARPVFKRIKKMNFRLNFKNAFGKICKNPFKKFGDFICHLNKATFKEFGKAVYYSGNFLFDYDLKNRIGEDYDTFKNAPSAKSHIDHYINWANNYHNEKPHFACIHIDDIHNPEEFFTYDCEDEKLFDRELKNAEEILDKIPENYYGSITHELSLRYADSIIEYLFNELSERGMLENSYVAICADHGFSFSGNPIRDSFVTNLYLENYNMPFLLYGNDLSVKNVTKLCQSKDIPATLCNILLGKIPEEFSGHDILSDFEYPQLEIEYCGGGCPDIKRRDLKIAAFDKDYFVGTLSKITENENIVTEIYD